MKKYLTLFSTLLFITLLEGNFLHATSKPSRETRIIYQKFLSSKGDQLIYEPDRNIKKTEYSIYYFSKKRVTSILGRNPLKGKPFSLTFSVLKVKKSYFKPKDPRMQAPIGGFLITRYYCAAIRAHSVPKK